MKTILNYIGENKRYYFIDLFIILALFFILGYQKDIWFCDEVYTYTSANSYSLSNGFILDKEDEWVTGSDVINFLSATDRNLDFKTISDNLFDDHVPLYFYLFRIFSVFALGSCSKWIGLLLNLIFYIAMYIILNKLISNILGSNNINLSHIIAVTAIMLHPLVLSEALTIRMYIMFSFAQVLFIFILDKEDCTLKKMVFLGMVSVFGLLTHFYFWIWTGIFSILYILYLAICMSDTKKKIHVIFSYIITMLFSLGITTVIFPNWIKNIFFNQSKGNLSLMKILNIDNLLEEFLSAIMVTYEQLLACFKGIGIIVLVFAIVVIGFYLLIKPRNYKVMLIIASSIIYTFFVIHTQPSNEGRYVWSSSILMLIVFFIMLLEDLKFILQKKLNSNIRYSNILVGGGMAIFLLVNIVTSINPDNIFYLRNRSVEEYKAIRESADMPWIVFEDNVNWPFFCSMYDFTIPEKIKRCGSNSVASYDEVIDNTNEIIIYTVDANKSIEECLLYITGSCNRNISSYKKISRSYNFTVYKVILE